MLHTSSTLLDFHSVSVRRPRDVIYYLKAQQLSDFDFQSVFLWSVTSFKHNMHLINLCKFISTAICEIVWHTCSSSSSGEALLRENVAFVSPHTLEMQYLPLLADFDQNPKAFLSLCALSVSGVWVEWSHSPVFVRAKRWLCAAAGMRCGNARAADRGWTNQLRHRPPSELNVSGPTELKQAELAS